METGKELANAPSGLLEMNRGSDTESGEDEWFGVGHGTHGPLDFVPAPRFGLGMGAGDWFGNGVCEWSPMVGGTGYVSWNGCGEDAWFVKAVVPDCQDLARARELVARHGIWITAWAGSW